MIYALRELNDACTTALILVTMITAPTVIPLSPMFCFPTLLSSKMITPGCLSVSNDAGAPHLHSVIVFDATQITTTFAKSND